MGIHLSDLAVATPTEEGLGARREAVEKLLDQHKRSEALARWARPPRICQLDGDIAYAERGGDWQAVLHYYVVPFYFIDYALACCCALQFWSAASRDPRAALERYLALCARGGSAPFQTLVASAGLISPFAPGALADAGRQAEAVLTV